MASKVSSRLAYRAVGYRWLHFHGDRIRVIDVSEEQ